MKNGRIFLALLLIIALAALAGCANTRTDKVDLNRNTTGNGIVYDGVDRNTTDNTIRDDVRNDINKVTDDTNYNR